MTRTKLVAYLSNSNISNSIFRELKDILLHDRTCSSCKFNKLSDNGNMFCTILNIEGMTYCSKWKTK
jgi:hypothetical protein